MWSPGLSLAAVQHKPSAERSKGWRCGAAGTIDSSLEHGRHCEASRAKWKRGRWSYEALQVLRHSD